MADFYDIQVHWKTGRITSGRGVGNNAAWICECKQVLLGPHEDMYAIPPCHCGKRFRIVRGRKPKYVAKVIEIGG